MLSTMSTNGAAPEPRLAGAVGAAHCRIARAKEHHHAGDAAALIAQRRHAFLDGQTAAVATHQQQPAGESARHLQSWARLPALPSADWME